MIDQENGSSIPLPLLLGILGAVMCCAFLSGIVCAIALRRRAKFESASQQSSFNGSMTRTVAPNDEYASLRLADASSVTNSYAALPAFANANAPSVSDTSYATLQMAPDHYQIGNIKNLVLDRYRSFFIKVNATS